MAIKYKPRFISKAKTGRHSISKSIRELIYERDNYTCQYCCKKCERLQLSIEHVIPVSKGGIDDIINYITVCRSCNSSKKDTLLIDYIKKHWNIEISELPVHGDIIMDTPELDQYYREIRKKSFEIMRIENSLKGGEAFKKLEKIFRTNLWKSKYGRVLAKRFPLLPGQVRASIPLVEYIESDTRKPIYKLLLEFTKSANTRAIVDSIIRTLSNSNVNRTENIIKYILSEKYDLPTIKRIEQAYKRAKINKNCNNLFAIPVSMNDLPLKPSDLLAVKIEEAYDNYGYCYLDNYLIKVKNAENNIEYEIVVEETFEDFAIARIAYLPETFEND